MLPSPAQIEDATLAAWPALEEARDGQWLWRWARGYTKRANAIHCLDPEDGNDAAARLDRMVALSEARGIPPVFRVTPLTSAGAIREIATRGWVEYEPSRVMLMEMPEADWPVAGRTELVEATSEAWLAAQASLAGYDETTATTIRDIVNVIRADATKGIIGYAADGQVVSAALASVSNGIGVYLNVIVRRGQRRQGHGRDVMAAALNWTKAAGAQHAAIQVLGSNQPAINLYASLGFAERYAYHYRLPPEQVPA